MRPLEKARSKISSEMVRKGFKGLAGAALLFAGIQGGSVFERFSRVDSDARNEAQRNLQEAHQQLEAELLLTSDQGVDPTNLQTFRSAERLYLMDRIGTVVAHSQQGYVGNHFENSTIYREHLRALFTNPSIRVLGATSVSFDGLTVRAQAERVEGREWILVSEVVTPVGIWRWIGALEGALRESTAALAAALMAFLVSRAIRRFSRKGRAASPPVPPVFRGAAPVFPAGADLAGPVRWAGEPVVQTHAPDPVREAPISVSPAAVPLPVDLRARFLEEAELLDEYEWNAAHLRNPDQIAERLVKAASELCDSPALFFRYQDAYGSAVLQADAGFTEGLAPVGMSFPIDSKTLGALLASAQKGEHGSLSDHAPLHTLVLARLGVAVFDAWAITGFSHLGRLSRRPRLLGVLVILQSGVESFTRRKSLGRMMRSTGLIYENTLLSQ